MFATPAQEASNKIVTVPAPIGGLNARDSLAAMPETDAIVSINFWPQPYGVAVRLGWQEWSQYPLGSAFSSAFESEAFASEAKAFETLATWNSSSGAQKLFAWAGDGVYDCTVKGQLTPPVVSGLTNAIWQSILMVNAAGSHLIAVNGLDDAILYNESGFDTIVAGNGTDPNTWSGLNPADAIQLTVHQHRLWATKENSAVGYYLEDLDAIYGVFGTFDFGPIFSLGGYIAFMTTWTIDDGNGAEDHLVVVSSTGQAVVYAGIDPTDPATWSLVGVYNIGAPVKGRRGYAKVGGDLYILTQQGIVSMASMLVSTRVNEQVTSFPSYKIQYLMSELISQYGDLQGWQLMYVPKNNMLLCNVPTTVNGGNIQLAANQLNGSWTQFANMDAACWGLFGEKPFFGDYNGHVCIAWEGYLDDVKLDNTGGTNVEAIIEQAYSYMGSLGTQKQVGMYRPVFLGTESQAYGSSIFYDFLGSPFAPPDSLPTPPNVNLSAWDSAIWDLDIWEGGRTANRTWTMAQGLGVAASLAIIVKATGSVLWISTDYSYKIGGLL